MENFQNFIKIVVVAVSAGALVRYAEKWREIAHLLVSFLGAGH